MTVPPDDNDKVGGAIEGGVKDAEGGEAGGNVVPFEKLERRGRGRPRKAVNGDAKDAGGADNAGDRVGARRQINRLMEIAALADLWIDQDGRSCATVAINGHRENLEVESTPFRGWLRNRYAEAWPGRGEGGNSLPGVVSTTAVNDVVATLEASAKQDHPTHTVYRRVARHDGAIYLDLASSDRAVVQITTEGWAVVDRCPVKFRRSPIMQMLPRPCVVDDPKIKDPRKDIRDLGHLLGLIDGTAAGEKNFWLLVGWFLMAFHPDGPFPVLAVGGESGAGKSMLADLSKHLVDPYRAGKRNPPKEERDLAVAAGQSRVLIFDNASRLDFEMSDAICRLATGMTFATRKNYTDADENLVEAKNPVIITSIGDITTRSDLER